MFWNNSESIVFWSRKPCSTVTRFSFAIPQLPQQIVQQGGEGPSHDPDFLIPGREVDSQNAMKGRGGEIQPGTGRQLRILGLEILQEIEGQEIPNRLVRQIELESRLRGRRTGFRGDPYRSH